MNEFMKNFSLEGKIAFVTGASYGIGFAIASAYAAAGATIVFNDINQELVNKGLAAYEEKGIKAHGYVCDVTDEEAVQKTVAKIREEVGIIDILVNNAGIIKRIPMLEMSAADFRKVIDVDLNAPFIVSKACIPGMIEKGHGKIINICSMMSELGRETVSAYAAAKGGLSVFKVKIRFRIRFVFQPIMPPFLTVCLETRILHACFEQAAVFPLRGGQLGVFVRGNRRKPVKFTAHIQRHALLIRQSQING